MDTLMTFLARDHEAKLLREAELERLRRSALGSGRAREAAGGRWRPSLRLGRPRWAPRPAG